MTIVLLFVFYVLEPLYELKGLKFNIFTVAYLLFEYIIDITLPHPLLSALKFRANCLRSQIT